MIDTQKYREQLEFYRGKVEDHSIHSWAEELEGRLEDALNFIDKLYRLNPALVVMGPDEIITSITLKNLELSNEIASIQYVPDTPGMGMEAFDDDGPVGMRGSIPKRPHPLYPEQANGMVDISDLLGFK